MVNSSSTAALQPIQFSLGLSQNQELGLNIQYQVMIKRFMDKLFIVITDGQKFGNVISASFQRLDENIDDEILDNLQSDLDQDLPDGTGEVEDYKVEYNAQLLLGDKTQQKWLELFSQNFLRLLIKLPQYKDIQSILTTISTGSELKKIEPKRLFLLSKQLCTQIDEQLRNL
eukprot:403356516